MFVSLDFRGYLKKYFLIKLKNIWISFFLLIPILSFSISKLELRKEIQKIEL